MNGVINYRVFDVTGSSIKIRLNTQYFNQAVPVYTVELAGTKTWGLDKIGDKHIVSSLMNFFQSKSTGKTFEISDPDFEFECDFNGEERICSATFEFRDFTLLITEIRLKE